MKTVYICIGNTDKKLSYVEYEDFIDDVRVVVEYFANIHGFWKTQVGDHYQNACWCVEINTENDKDLKDDLRILAERYRQDSIKYDIVDTPVFIKPREIEDYTQNVQTME